MKRRVFLGLGAASIGTGALISTGAFSSLEAGRGVAVSAASGKHALLGVDPVEDTIEVSNDEAVVAEVINNFSEDITVSSISVVSIDGDSTDDDSTGDDLVEVVSPTIDDSISSDGTDVIIGCNSETDTKAEATIKLEVDGSSISVRNVTFDVTLDIQCQPTVFGVNGELDQDGPQGSSIELTIKTTEDTAATVTDYSIMTQGNLDDVAYRDNGDTTFDGGELPAEFDEDGIRVILDRFGESRNSSIPVGLVIEDENFTEHPEDGDIVLTLEGDVEGQEERFEEDLGIAASRDD